jgi:hypothetical protein
LVKINTRPKNGKGKFFIKMKRVLNHVLSF